MKEISTVFRLGIPVWKCGISNNISILETCNDISSQISVKKYEWKSCNSSSDRQCTNMHVQR